MEFLQNEFFVCQCMSDEHTLRFTFDAEDRVIYTGVFLNAWESWYKRLWAAVRYVCGYKCKYGHWDSFMMRSEDVARMRRLLDEFDAASPEAQKVLETGTQRLARWETAVNEKIKETSESTYTLGDEAIGSDTDGTLR